MALIMGVRNPRLDNGGLRTVLLQLQGQQPSRSQHLQGHAISVIDEALPPIIERNIRRENTPAGLEPIPIQNDQQVAFKAYEPGKNAIENTLEPKNGQKPNDPPKAIKTLGEKNPSQRSLQEVVQARTKANEERNQENAIPLANPEGQVEIEPIAMLQSNDVRIKDDEEFVFSDLSDSEQK